MVRYYKNTWKPYKGYIKSCPVCGADAVIREDDGIGYVACSWNYKHAHFRYSDRCGRKSDAIRKWNEYNGSSENMNG